MFGQLGYSLLQNVVGPPVGIWLWVSASAPTRAGDTQDLWLSYEDVHGNRWAFSTAVYASWYAPPPLWRIEIDNDDVDDRWHLTGHVWDA